MQHIAITSAAITIIAIAAATISRLNRRMWEEREFRNRIAELERQVKQWHDRYEKL